MGGSIGEHVWRRSYKMSTSQVTFGANLIKCQLLMSTSTVILARILQSVNFSIYRYILGNTNTGVCSDIGNTNTSIHPVSYCPIWDEAVLIPSLTSHSGLAVTLARRTLFLRAFLDASLDVQIYGCVNMYTQHAVESFIHSRGHAHLHAHAHTYPVKCMQMCGV